MAWDKDLSNMSFAHRLRLFRIPLLVCWLGMSRAGFLSISCFLLNFLLLSLARERWGSLDIVMFGSA